MNIQKKLRLRFIGLVLLAIFAGAISYPQFFSFYPPIQKKLETLKIHLGLDLQGGIHLEYKVDTSNLAEDKKDDALQAAQDVIERRINAFGVGEPLVQLAFSGGENRIIVELPGIKDVEEAKKQIKETPFLEFKEDKGDDEEVQKTLETINESIKGLAQEVLEKAKSGEDFVELAKEHSQDPGSKDNGGDLDFVKRGVFVPEFDKVIFDGNLQDGEIHSELVETQFGWHIIQKMEDRDNVENVDNNGGSEEEGSSDEEDNYEVRARHILFSKRTLDHFPDLKYAATDLTGENLERADVVFASQGVGEPQVSLTFDSEGAQKFAEITKNNIGKTVAIYLDGMIISAPTVQTEITNGEAVITGSFTLDDAKALARRLNEGALPVPLELVSQQSIEASLGADSLQKSLRAGALGIALVIVFMVIYYRFLGIVAGVSILIYSAFMISLFKLSGFLSPWPITLTLSGIAGFILSVGMAVDANILIFERTREELKNGRNIKGALATGFNRAWPSIRDGNVSTIITAFILIWFGTGFVKGFAVILLFGVLLSMFTAIVLVKTILSFVVGEWLEKRKWLI